MNPFTVVRDFELALANYVGAPFCVTTTSCTMALLLATRWFVENPPPYFHPEVVRIPKRTYVGVPMSVIHAGAAVQFTDEDWRGAYRLNPLPIWDSARRFRWSMYISDKFWDPTGVQRAPVGEMVCVSFHWSKVLGIEQGGAIFHSDPEADRWLRKARFDGREEGVAPKDQKDWILGYHAYMSPETAAKGLMRLSLLQGQEPDLPNSDYPDLSTIRIFR